jgi:hypothetical protein
VFIEAIQSVWQTFRERLKNPTVGAFIVSWGILNWRIVLILFSSLPLVEKFDLIDTLGTEWGTLFFVPLGSSVLYVLAMPWILFGVELWQSKPIRLRKAEILGLETEIVKKRLELVQQRQKVREVELDIKHIEEREKEAGRLKSDCQSKLQKLDERESRLSAQEGENSRMRKDLRKESEGFSAMKRDAEAEKREVENMKKRAVQNELTLNTRKDELDRLKDELDRRM